MNELSCIQAFVSIVENGSQLEAAKQLNQTSAAINKKLAKLEQKLGVALLERDTKSSKLTDIGEQYYHAYRDILDKLDETNQIAKQYAAKPTGRLMITLDRSTASHKIIPHLNEFNKAYPDILLVLDIAEKTGDFIPGKQDILIAPDTITHENLVRRKYFESSHIICASPAYIKQFGTPQKPQDLYHHRYIGQCQRLPLHEITLSKKHKVELKNSFIRTNDTETSIELARQGLGFIYVSSNHVADLLERGDLIQLLGDYTHNTTSYFFYYHSQLYISPKIKVFIDFYMRTSS